MGKGRLPCAIDTVNVQARVDDWQRHSHVQEAQRGLVNAAKMRLSASTDFSVRTYPGTVLGNSKSLNIDRTYRRLRLKYSDNRLFIALRCAPSIFVVIPV